MLAGNRSARKLAFNQNTQFAIIRRQFFDYLFSEMSYVPVVGAYSVFGLE